MVGGTASSLSGGKFSNGAVTGAFSRMFNDEMHASSKKGAYNSSDGYYHYYEMENQVCTISLDGCSASAVWDELKSNPAPGWDSSKQVATGDETNIRFMKMSGGDVSHVVDDANMTLYNVTHPNHIFSDGYVSRSVITRNGSVYIRTVGEGITSPGVVWAGPIPLTRPMRAAVNMKLYRLGFDALDANIRGAF